MRCVVSPACIVHKGLNDMMYSRVPSFVIILVVLVGTVNIYLSIHEAIKIRQILLKHFHLITLGINTVKHSRQFSCPWRNIVTFECRFIDFKRLRHLHVRLQLGSFWCYSFVTSWSWLLLWRHYWLRQWLGRVHHTDWERCLYKEWPRDRTSFWHVLNYFTCHVMKAIQNGCPCVVEIRST